MIYPAQTSLIPVQVALARFLETNGFAAALGNYPYWYLGSTPFRYLTGPILPLVLVGLHKVLPFLSLFEIMLGLVGVVWLVGGIGMYALVRELERENKWIAVLAAVFYLFGPMVPFLFRFADGLYLIAFSFLPYVLLVYYKWLKSEDRGRKTGKIEILLCLLIAFIILLDSLMIPTLLLGIAAIFLAEVGWKKAEEKLKQTLLVISCSFLVATIWYTPGYWLTLLGAPSLGGMGVMRVIEWLGKLLPAALAIGAAVFSVKFFKKKDILRDFCFYWLFIFGFLSLLRFLSDTDFWLDWSSYAVEIQLGIGIALGMLLRQRTEDREQKTRIEDGKLKTDTYLSSIFGLLRPPSVFYLRSSLFFAFYLLIFAFITNKYVLGTLQKDITQSVEYRIGRQLSGIAKPNERVFLSGTTAFWLNAFFDLPQVRGGKDQVAVDPNWRKAVWEIREDPSASSGLEILKKMGVTYLVVHTSASQEFYHDFKYPEKFEEVEGLEKIYEEEGDRIYRVED